MEYDYKAIVTQYKEAFENVFNVIKNAVNAIHKNIISPLYDSMLLPASAENPKWYYYYKNAKTEKTREKYRVLLQDKFLVMAKAKFDSKRLSTNELVGNV